MQLSTACFCFYLPLVLGLEIWKPLPEIPAGHRAEYYLLHKDGGYKHGLDTGTGIFAKAKASPENEVKGHFGHTIGGSVVDIMYTAGVQGYVPEGDSIPRAPSVSSESNDSSASVSAPPSSPSVPDIKEWNDSESGSDSSADKSYSFSYSTADSSRSESSDASGNVQGQYAYKNTAGNHDLSYNAGADTGFVVTGGSLSVPNGLSERAAEPAVPTPSSDNQPSSISSNLNTDGSYSFSYSAPDSSRSESGYANGNVEGQYAYRNDEGNHDLSYTAGSETGFVVTGGSLGIPNGLGGKEIASDGESDSGSTSDEAADSSSTSDGAANSDSTSDGQSDSTITSNGESDSGSALNEASDSISTSDEETDSGSASNEASDSSSSNPSTNMLNNDGFYSFSYIAPDSSRSESGDASGNVQGEYAYQNNAENHDLSYSAGADTGFVVTGGSLAIPNGLTGAQSVSNPTPPLIPVSIGYHILQNHGIGSASSSASSSDPAESSSTAGNENDEGSDSESEDSADKTDDLSSVIKSDGSYSFIYSNPDSSRRESGDANGNVEGYFAYVNEAGRHDLFYESGAETGFVAVGGSLSEPNGLRETDETVADHNQAGDNAESEGSGSGDESSTNEKVFLNFGDLSAIKLLPVSDNVKVGYILE